MITWQQAINAALGRDHYQRSIVEYYGCDKNKVLIINEIRANGNDNKRHRTVSGDFRDQATNTSSGISSKIL